MQRFNKHSLSVMVVFGSIFALGAPVAQAQTCTCDLANADIAPCGGPDGAVGFGDLQFIDYCVTNQADFCGRSLSVCDINCDGVVDYRDYGETIEAVFTGVASGPCLNAYGACCSINQTHCVQTTGRACDVLNVDEIPGDGVYAGDGIPCDPSPCDCNGNAIADSVDLTDGTSFDCNANGLLDECDIANSFAFDTTPPNGVPDECDSYNRFIHFTMNDLVPNATEPYAIRVTLVAINGFGAFDGEVRWVGPAFDAPDEDVSDPTRTFKAAHLECTSYYTDWGTSDLIFVEGGEILPNSVYAIQAIAASCDEAQETCYTPAGQWMIDTGLWGDAIAPYEGSGSVQPNFLDIAGTVAKFVAEAGAPPKPHFQLVPNTVFPDRAVDFKDISAAVAAFVGDDYVTVLGAGVGPCTCPSSVICGTTSCLQDLDCAPGFCVNSFCTDECRRCTP